MEKGFLQGHQRVAWVKKKHKFSLLPKSGEVLLANHTFDDFFFEAYICKACKKIVVDFSGADFQEGTYA